MAKSFEDIRTSVKMMALEASNWKSDGTTFHSFDSIEELECYLLRSEDGEWWDEEKGRYDFEQCVFNFEIKSWGWLREFNSPAIFKLAQFNSRVSFKGLTFCENADFDGCTFADEVDFSGVKFKSDFNPGVFENIANFTGAVFSTAIIFHSFQKDAYFDYCKFEQGAEFMNSIFSGKAFFRYCTFSENTFFKKCIFTGDAFFHETIFGRNADFEGAEFKGKFNSWDIECIGGGISFRWADFRKKANLSKIIVDYNGNETYTVSKTIITDGLNLKQVDEEINYVGKLVLHGTNFEENAYFYDAKINILDLEKSVIDKGVFFLNASINNTNRETYRIIKHEFLKQDNKIEALKYYGKEMAEYEYELFGKKPHLKFSIVRFFRDFRLVFTKGDRTNKFIVFINRISNGFNSKPFRGVGFTLLSTLLFYWLILLILKIENDISFSYSYKYLGVNFKQLLELLNVTNWNYHPFNLKCEWAYGVLVVGRVVIGYGIYQTIQAFRKFGKP